MLFDIILFENHENNSFNYRLFFKLMAIIITKLLDLNYEIIKQMNSILMAFWSVNQLVSIKQAEFAHLQIYISFYEIYCGKLFDLLNERQHLHAREDGKANINIVGLTEQRIINVDQLLKIIEFGMSARVTGTKQ